MTLRRTIPPTMSLEMSNIQQDRQNQQATPIAGHLLIPRLLPPPPVASPSPGCLPLPQSHPLPTGPLPF